MIQDGYWLRLDNQDVAQVLAALRFWQSNDMCSNEDREFLAGYGHFESNTPMSCEQIDSLCERLNFGGYYSEQNEARRAAANEQYGDEGQFEVCIDTDAAISDAQTHCFVQAWVLVDERTDDDYELNEGDSDGN